MTVRAGIVGLGRWGRILVDSVAAEPSLKFVAAASRNPSAIADYCAGRDIALFGSLDALLADGDIDALVIATPHQQHFEQIMKAAKAGKHVFCEKPFTLTAKEAETALQTLAEAGLTVGIGHNRRFSPNTIALKKDLADGRLGKPIHIDGQFNVDLSGAAENWRNSRAESPAGGMTSLGIHILDAFIHLLGRVASVRTTSLHASLPFDIDDNTHVSMRFENGCTGNLTTIAATAMLWRLTVFGNRGWAEAEGFDSYRLTPVTGEPEHRSFSGYDYPAPQTIAAGLKAFAAAVEGGAPFPISPEEIGHATTVLEAVIESASTGITIEIRS
ncbi:MAG: Gfo/Idh/MocA family oxidoreductase [Alphaproteobacteria bacterium]